MQREYNVRVIETDGKLELGFVHGLYYAKPEMHKGKKMKMKTWKNVPDTVKSRLEKKMGIK